MEGSEMEGPEKYSTGSSEKVPSKNNSRRELNPALFGDPSTRGKVFDSANNNISQMPLLIQTEQKIQDVKAQMSMVAEHLGKWTEQYTEFSKSCQVKFDRIQQVLMKLENNDQYIVNETSQKFARINDRFGERKAVDAKIQEMIDRHNSVLKSFEMRLSQMQKMINDREAQLLATQSLLHETKMELARLKRL